MATTLRVTIPAQLYGYYMVLLEQSGIPLRVLLYPHAHVYGHHMVLLELHFESYCIHSIPWPPHGTPGTPLWELLYPFNSMASTWYSWNSQEFHFESYCIRSILWPPHGTPGTVRNSTLRVTVSIQFHGLHMVLLEQSGIPLWELMYPFNSMASTWYSWNNLVFHFESYCTRSIIWPPHVTPGTVRYSTLSITMPTQFYGHHMVLLEQSGIPTWELQYPRSSMASFWPPHCRYSWNSQVFHFESNRIRPFVGLLNKNTHGYFRVCQSKMVLLEQLGTGISLSFFQYQRMTDQCIIPRNKHVPFTKSEIYIT